MRYITALLAILVNFGFAFAQNSLSGTVSDERGGYFLVSL